MKLRRNKKGFTIVELVIVIAVIGVLAAILIPVFVNLTNKANKASDESLVKNLNTALAMQEQEIGDTKNNTLHDAVEDLDTYGYKLNNLVTKSDEKLLWSQETNRFFLEDRDADEIAKYAKTSLWRIQNDANDADGYSIYAGLGFTATTVDVKVGFDVGYHDEIDKINYERVTNDVDDKQTVVIRTNSANTSVEIDAKNDTVNHYGDVGKVDVKKIDLNCYNEFGEASYVKITEGKIVAKEGGKIAVAFANNLDGTKVAVIEDKGTIETGYTITEPVANANEQRDGGISLEFYIDNEHAGSATQDDINAAIESIEETGELSVASETGVLPAGLDYTAVVKNVGYNSLNEAIEAAHAGDIVSLLKDYTTNSERLLINKALTINGNNHSITNTRAQSTFAPYNTRSGRDAAIYVNSSVSINDLTLKTTESCFMHVIDETSNVSINIDNCVFEAPSNKYGLIVGNYSNNLDIKITNSDLAGWASIYMKCHHSRVEIINSKLYSFNGTSIAPSNGFGTIVIDTNGGYDNPESTPENEGCYNTLIIKDTDIYANTDGNAEIWLVIQYRAHHNTVTVTGGNIYSTNPITPEHGWEYHHKPNGSHGTDEDIQDTNTVTINGVQYYGFPSNHD